MLAQLTLADVERITGIRPEADGHFSDEFPESTIKPGNRNDGLFRRAIAKYHDAVPIEVAWHEMYLLNEAIVDDEGNPAPLPEEELRTILRSAYSGKPTKHRDVPTTPATPAPVTPNRRPGLGDDKFTDHVVRCQPDLLWIRQTDELLRFLDGRYHDISEKEVRELVIILMRDAFEVYGKPIPDDAPEEDLNYRKLVEEFSAQRYKAKFASTVVSIAGPRMAISKEQLDADDDLLAVGGGQVIDLRTFEMRPGKPADLLTRGSDIILPDGIREPNCPLWLQHIELVTCGDSEYADYLQRLFGYYLTGHTGEQKCWVALGEGSNGKGVTFFTLMKLLGDLGDVMAYTTFTQTKQAKDGSAATPDKADMAGKRLAIIDENEKQIVFSNAAIQQWTGKSPMKVRKNYGHPFTMEVKAKLVFLCNWPPKLDTTKYATQRRIVVLPFEALFTPEDGSRILEYDDYLVAKEGPEILLWAIEGLRKYREFGEGALEPKTSSAIYKATNEYFQKSNILHEIIEAGVVVLEKGAEAEWNDLFRTFTEWWDDNDFKRHPNDDIADALRSYGCRNERRQRGGQRDRVWKGIRIKEATE